MFVPIFAFCSVDKNDFGLRIFFHLDNPIPNPIPIKNQNKNRTKRTRTSKASLETLYICAKKKQKRTAAPTRRGGSRGGCVFGDAFL